MSAHPARLITEGTTGHPSYLRPFCELPARLQLQLDAAHRARSGLEVRLAPCLGGCRQPRVGVAAPRVRRGRREPGGRARRGVAVRRREPVRELGLLLSAPPRRPAGCAGPTARRRAASTSRRPERAAPASGDLAARTGRPPRRARRRGRRRSRPPRPPPRRAAGSAPRAPAWRDGPAAAGVATGAALGVPSACGDLREQLGRGPAAAADGSFASPHATTSVQSRLPAPVPWRSGCGGGFGEVGVGQLHAAFAGVPGLAVRSGARSAAWTIRAASE